MMRTELGTVAHGLVARGKGILAADESFPTIEKGVTGRPLPMKLSSRKDLRRWTRVRAGLLEDNMG